MRHRFVLRDVAYHHPQVVELLGLAERLHPESHGAAETDPLDPEDVSPPRGRFLLGSLDGRPVATGGWHRLAGSPHREAAALSRSCGYAEIEPFTDHSLHGAGELYLGKRLS